MVLHAALSADHFDVEPVSLWREDYSGLKALFDPWRAQGVVDLAALRDSEGQLRLFTSQLPGMLFRVHMGLDGGPAYQFVSAGVETLLRSHRRRCWPTDGCWDRWCTRMTGRCWRICARTHPCTGCP
jgi:hypothetical protein